MSELNSTSAPAPAPADMLAILRAKAEAAPVEQEFQQYKAAKAAVRLITREGIRITFTNFQYLTQNPDVIDYLDEEIAKGLQGITKGGVLSTSDLDPMQSMRKQARADLMAELEQEALDEAKGVSKDMGETEHKAQISPMSSKSVANK